VSRSLGRHPRFRPWACGPQRWGPDAASSATFGASVVDDLIGGIGRFADETPAAVALGCVYQFTDNRLARLLADLDFCTVVVDKSSVNDHTRMLERRGEGLPLAALESEGLGGYVTSMGGHQLGAVRLAGDASGPRRSLLHAKLLLLGIPHETVADTDAGEYRIVRMEPARLWFGSANWTRLSADHLEMGVWSEDRALLSHALQFLTGVVALSEPFRNRSSGPPEPELALFEPDYGTLHDPWEQLE
jgi:hypothetical protein